MVRSSRPELLAKIDETVYVAEVSQAQAQLAMANAGVKRAEADLLQLKAKFNQAERDWERAKKLGRRMRWRKRNTMLIRRFRAGEGECDCGRGCNYRAKATVDSATATLDRANRNLSYCTIISPVNGVIIDRRVNIGQTVVAASMRQVFFSSPRT